MALRSLPALGLATKWPMGELVWLYANLLEGKMGLGISFLLVHWQMCSHLTWYKAGWGLRVGRLGLTAVITVQLMWGERGTGLSHTGSTLCSLCQHFIHPRKYKGAGRKTWIEVGRACSGAGGVRLGEGVWGCVLDDCTPTDDSVMLVFLTCSFEQTGLKCASLL